MAASNTKECFREVIGLRVVGVMFDAMPSHRADLAGGNTTLVFEDGTGLTIASNGSYWRENASDVKRAVEKKKQELTSVQRDLRDVIVLAGAT